MARNHLVRFLGYPTPRDYRAFFYCQCIYVLSAVLYYLTLEGGDLEYLKAKTTYFAVMLILSVVCALTASVYAKVTYTTTNSTFRLGSWAGGGLIMLFTVTRDLGTSLQSHGQFNLIVYFLVWLPIVGFVLMYQGCHAAKERISNARL